MLLLQYAAFISKNVTYQRFIYDVHKSNVYLIYLILKIEIQVAVQFMVYIPDHCVKYKHW